MISALKLRKSGYNEASATRFVQYFKKPDPKPRKRGRPRKKRRNQPSLAAQAKRHKKQAHVSVTYKGVSLRVDLEGAVAQATTSGQKKTRINWDKEPHQSHRERLAESWRKKNDLYNGEDSFARFCKRNGIARQVLSRFLEREKNTTSGQRGRPTFLSKDVMRHICEGW